MATWPKPRLLRAVAASVAPVPPLATATAVPCQVPAVIVPSVVRFVLPAQVDTAVFSTLPRPRLVRAVEALAKSPRFADFWAAPVILLSSPAATVLAAVPTFSTAAPPRPRLVRAVEGLARSLRSFPAIKRPVLVVSFHTAAVLDASRQTNSLLVEVLIQREPAA